MGERSNIVVIQPDLSRIYLYGHWMGDDNYRVVGEVLSRNERWSDAAYLGRMLFSKMIEADISSDSGYGISTHMCDNSYPLVVVNPLKQTVVLQDVFWDNEYKFTDLTPEVSFEEFVNTYSVSESLNDLAVAMGAKLTPA